MDSLELETLKRHLKLTTYAFYFQTLMIMAVLAYIVIR